MKYTLTDRLMWHFMQGTCYKVLHGSQMSLPLYEKMCRASIAMPMMLRMARMTKPFTRKFQESMMKRSERENRIDSPYNWQAHYKQGKVDEEFTLSYTRCGLCELARKRGHLDIQKRNAKRKRQEC